MIPTPVLALIAIAGLCVGSFLNVCIYRLPRGLSVAWPPSHCPRCRQPIAWYHNVPVLAWVWLRGRCARCRAPIPVVYPLVEAGTCALFVVTAVATGWDVLLVPRLLLTAALVALFVIDLQHQLLPNPITLPGIAVGLAFSVFLPPGLFSATLGVLLGGGLPYLIAWAYLKLRGAEGLGMGDVKMLAMVGAFLGWPLMLLTLFLGSIGGAVAGITMMAAGRGSMTLRLPFGTFLAAAAWAVMLWGAPLVTWYAGTLR
jgi:leader peptidase (prepilin peptidase)/N-methyltransferase